MARADKKSYQILIADDCEWDRLVLAHFLHEANPDHSLHHVEDGVCAIAFLAGDGIYADRERYPFPDLAIIDLKMPKCDGFSVLEWLNTRSFPNLTIVALSGSLLPGERERALSLGAHYHALKPFENQNHRELIARIEQFLHSQPEQQPGPPSMADVPTERTGDIAA